MFLSLVGLTITHLKQVVDRMSSLKEEDLAKLDQVINSYLAKRREGEAKQQTFQSQIQSQLIQLQQKNGYLLKELDILTRNYEKEKQIVAESNKQWILDTQELVDSHPFQELCRELIVQLAQYRQISPYTQRLQQIKRQSNDRHFVQSNLQEFMQKMDEIMRDDNENEGMSGIICDYYSDH